MTWSRLRLCFGSLAAGSFVSLPNLQRDETRQKNSFENLTTPNKKSSYDFKEAITNTENKILQAMVAHNIPGACCVVSVNGRTVMKSGFGFSDIENLVPFTSRTSMRIASISKLVTALITLRLMENGLVALDEPLGDFLAKHGVVLSRGGVVEEGVTVRQLLNHTAGIRHYNKTCKDATATGDSASDEFYSSTHYPTVSDALSMFIRDDLESDPGTTFNYTTFGYTLLSFVLEKAAGMEFEKLVSEFRADLGLKSVQFDKGDRIIPNRCRYYSNADNGTLQNTPAVDLSCKWAGGGLVSNAEDIALLGDILLYLIQQDEIRDEESGEGGGNERYLRGESIRNMTAYNQGQKQHIERYWSKGTEVRKSDGTEEFYGLGVMTCPQIVKHGKIRQFHRVLHTGGAVGASSVLMVVPISPQTSSQDQISVTPDLLHGITVVLFCNHEKGGPVIRLAADIAAEFLTQIES